MSESKKAKPRAAQSFTEREVVAMAELFEVLRRGGDPRLLLRSEALHSVHHKFVIMRAKYVEAAPQAHAGNAV